MLDALICSTLTLEQLFKNFHFDQQRFQSYADFLDSVVKEN